VELAVEVVVLGVIVGEAGGSSVALSITDGIESFGIPFFFLDSDDANADDDEDDVVRTTDVVADRAVVLFVLVIPLSASKDTSSEH